MAKFKILVTQTDTFSEVYEVEADNRFQATEKLAKRFDKEGIDLSAISNTLESTDHDFKVIDPKQPEYADDEER